MALSSDLQDMVADVSAAIAGAQTLGRAELEIWRRRLSAAAKSATTIETKATVTGAALDDLCAGIDRGIADFAALAAHARARVPA